MRSHLWVKECLKLDFGEEEDGKLSTSTNSQRTPRTWLLSIRPALGYLHLKWGTLTTRQRNADCRLLGEGESASPRDEPLSWLSNAERSVLKPYIYKQKQTQQVAFLYPCEYTHRHLHVCNNKKLRSYHLEGGGPRGTAPGEGL